ncbi:hypothetical protein PR048_025146 [Dryococelus australis]|uniref:Uncharacterized protein n=1 Tax=Dryococelus australis TaxID=614101 RepID=A0ABQ9GQG8_9NEOP|nr:hypothetical protein PR048_025146 [Dryococelus australis]
MPVCRDKIFRISSGVSFHESCYLSLRTSRYGEFFGIICPTILVAATVKARNVPSKIVHQLRKVHENRQQIAKYSIEPSIQAATLAYIESFKESSFVAYTLVYTFCILRYMCKINIAMGLVALFKPKTMQRGMCACPTSDWLREAAVTGFECDCDWLLRGAKVSLLAGMLVVTLDGAAIYAKRGRLGGWSARWVWNRRKSKRRSGGRASATASVEQQFRWRRRLAGCPASRARGMRAGQRLHIHASCVLNDKEMFKLALLELHSSIAYKVLTPTSSCRRAAAAPPLPDIPSGRGMCSSSMSPSAKQKNYIKTRRPRKENAEQRAASFSYFVMDGNSRNTQLWVNAFCIHNHETNDCVLYMYHEGQANKDATEVCSFFNDFIDEFLSERPHYCIIYLMAVQGSPCCGKIRFAPPSVKEFRYNADKPSVLEDLPFIDSLVKHTFSLGKGNLDTCCIHIVQAYTKGEIPINPKKIEALKKLAVSLKKTYIVSPTSRKQPRWVAPAQFDVRPREVINGDVSRLSSRRGTSEVQRARARTSSAADEYSPDTCPPFLPKCRSGPVAIAIPSGAIVAQWLKYSQWLERSQVSGYSDPKWGRSGPVARAISSGAAVP